MYSLIQVLGVFFIFELFAPISCQCRKHSAAAKNCKEPMLSLSDAPEIFSKINKDKTWILRHKSHIIVESRRNLLDFYQVYAICATLLFSAYNEFEVYRLS